MRIHFERSGGFAGMRVTVTVDTELLSPQEAHDLERSVDAARFFELPATITAPIPGADRFCYKITVEAEGQRHTIEVDDAALPDKLRPLLQRLTTLARSRRGS